MLNSSKNSSLVIDRLCGLANVGNTAVTGVYCDFHAQNEQTATGLLGVLLKQAVTALEPIPEEVQRAFENSKGGVGGRRLLLPETLEVLAKSLSRLRRVFICIDALDEFSGTIDTYEHSDRSRLIEFLQERSITDLRQVWLLNLEVIVRTEIDVDGEWLQTIGREMFGGDADMYVFHMSESYMAFCEPQSSEDEFILTDNGFGIFEGPVTYDTVNLKSTGADGSPPRLENPRYTEFHKLAPLSPRLILVLRSNFLRDEPIWKRRKEIFGQFSAQPGAVSLLQDLPIKPPKIHYWLPGKSKPIHTLEDEFFFEIYKVKTEQIHVINGLMFQESIRSITWVSDESLVKSLQAFLGNPDFMIRMSLPLLPEFTSFIALRFQKERLLSLWDKPYPTEGKGLEEFNKINEDMRNNGDL